MKTLLVLILLIVLYILAPSFVATSADIALNLFKIAFGLVLWLVTSFPVPCLIFLLVVVIFRLWQIK